MPTINDKMNGIVLNHDTDWGEAVRIAWHSAENWGHHHECWCSGPDLVAGRYSPVNEPGGEASHYDPPVNVLTRAVALAVESYLRGKMEHAVDNLFIRRSKL